MSQTKKKKNDSHASVPRCQLRRESGKFDSLGHRLATSDLDPPLERKSSHSSCEIQYELRQTLPPAKFRKSKIQVSQDKKYHPPNVQVVSLICIYLYFNLCLLGLPIDGILQAPQAGQLEAAPVNT